MDADRATPRLLVSWVCEGNRTAVIDVDGSPPKWIVAAEEPGCATRPVAVQGDTVMATLTGNPEDGSSDPGNPPSSVIFGTVRQKAPRVQHRVPYGSWIRELVADAHRWANVAEDGVWAADLGSDRTLVAPSGSRRFEDLRLSGDLLAWMVSSPGRHNESIQVFVAKSTAPTTLTTAMPGKSLSGLAVGPHDVLWSEEIDKGSCTLGHAKRPSLEAPKRFAHACPFKRPVVGAKYAAMNLEGGRVAILRLSDHAESLLDLPCRKNKPSCAPDVLAVSDTEIYLNVEIERLRTVLRAPIGPFEASTALTEIDAPAADKPAEDAGAPRDAGPGDAASH
jgi:hypothetical protein